MDIIWLGHASFKLNINKKNIYIDPFQIEHKFKDADFVLITHSHYDHCSIDDIKKVLNKDTIILASEDCNILNELPNKIHFILPNSNLNFNNINFYSVPAYNQNKNFHPKNKNWLGYIITYNNFSLYHTGDSDYIEEMKSLKPNLILVPVSGTYTMNYKEASEFINYVNPEYNIPMHFGSIVGTIKDAENYKELIKNSKTMIFKKNERKKICLK